MLDGIAARLLRISHLTLLAHAALVAPNSHRDESATTTGVAAKRTAARAQAALSFLQPGFEQSGGNGGGGVECMRLQYSNTSDLQVSRPSQQAL